MPYRMELCPNNRAGCKATDCKTAAVKITKGELRQGTWVKFQEHGSWHWRHWGCVTPKVVENMKDECDMNPEMIDGYDELDEENQEKVMRALEQGHVDDADWKGEEGFNIPGSSGKGPTAAQKKKMEAEKAKEAENGDESDAKPAPKKRARAKKTEAAEDDEDEPAPKKAKGRTKKATKDDDNDEPEAAPKKAKGRAKKPVKDESDEEPEPAPKKTTARTKKAQAAEPSSETEDLPTKKKAAAKPKKAAETKKAAAPKKAAKGKKAAPKAVSEDEAELSDVPEAAEASLSELSEVEEPVVKPKRGGGRKKNA